MTAASGSPAMRAGDGGAGLTAAPAPLPPAPFPWFGGKRRIAGAVWDELGGPAHYVEPFCGSMAVLLARPGGAGRLETVNDSDGWLVNAWRAIRDRPGEVARYCGGPVTEIDYHARLAWLQERRTDGLVAWLEGGPEVSDPKAAGWWLYVVACGIGWAFDEGPWRIVDGRLVKTDAGRGVKRELPHLGDAGRGVKRELPHLGDAGRGVQEWMEALARRIARVRITCGDWARTVTPSALDPLRRGSIGVLLDPPYTDGDQAMYVGENTGTADAARDWCAANGGNPRLRIVLCGRGGEHDALLADGWRKTPWRAGKGYANNNDGATERLWLSPHCLDPRPALFEMDDGSIP